MEAVALVGLLASCASIVDYSARAVNSLRKLRKRFRHVELNINNVIVQTDSIRAAVRRISDWLETNPSHLQGAGPILRNSLESCQNLIQLMMTEIEDV